MPLTTTTLTVGALNNGVVPLTINSVGVTLAISVQELKDRYRSSSGRQNFDYLFGQILKVIADAGLDPATATVTQMKVAIQAATYQLVI